MASFQKICRSGQILRKYCVIGSQFNRYYSDIAPWNKEWKPGPYPVTAAEREAAAKKYGLQPEDYEPYPDDGLGYGDYPKLKPLAAKSRDPYYPWDIPELRRNYGEVLHVDSDIFIQERYNYNKRHRVSVPLQWLSFLGVVGGMIFMYYSTKGYKSIRPVLQKQYPLEGVVHYTFEPATKSTE